MGLQEFSRESQLCMLSILELKLKLGKPARELE